MAGQDRLASERQLAILRRLDLLETQVSSMQDVHESIRRIEDTVGPLKSDVKTITEAWTQANGGVRALLYAMSLAGSLWMIISWGKEHLKL